MLVPLMASCQGKTKLPEATSAAHEVYQKYANREELTVAFIGKYHGYNAVMLQARDRDGWLRLCNELGVKKKVDADGLDSMKVSSITTVSHHVDTVGVDSIAAGRIGRSYHFDSVGGVGEALLQVMKDLAGADSIIPLNMTGTCLSIKKSVRYEKSVLVDSSTTFDKVAPHQDNALMHTAMRHGNNGYLIFDDSDSLTLWLFFFTTEEEFNQIIDNVSTKHLPR